jgi:hypothetical protein
MPTADQPICTITNGVQIRDIIIISTEDQAYEEIIVEEAPFSPMEDLEGERPHASISSSHVVEGLV